ncbi:MAG: YifB family Mg chelatase-like AAA ATPase [Spirochaetales bacterium]|nr:YifB family Mg chelatase-like AAA ATPase [Spirochaetales bacterium]
MALLAFAPQGYEGYLVSVEVDIRRGIPGLDVVGLPDSAVKEARERIKTAIRNSGFELPGGRILINLAPAGRRKEGAGFDLPMALGVLAAGGQVAFRQDSPLLVMGELTLGGDCRGVSGVLSAVAGAAGLGVRDFLVPWANLEEARAVRQARIFAIRRLSELPRIGTRLLDPRDGGDRAAPRGEAPPELPEDFEDFAAIRGQEELKRALEVAALGGHHLILFGPPGSGKTMSARSLAGILPPLSPRESLEVTRIHSLAGLLPEHSGLITQPVFRSPHHSASREGIIGGGRPLLPGEVSLAHRGVLFLDEAPEFHRDLLQNLREPLETGRVNLVRADGNCFFPAEFQLILAANPCPCGNLGKEKGVCICSPQEVRRYWRQLGGALMDRIDMRLPVRPLDSGDYAKGPGESSAQAARRIRQAREFQARRYTGEGEGAGPPPRNSRLTSRQLSLYCSLEPPEKAVLAKAIGQLGLSSRAVDSLQKLSRSLADLEGEERIGRHHLLEALQYRRYGDGDFFWQYG